MIRRLAALIASGILIVAAASWTPVQAAGRPHHHHAGHHYGHPSPASTSSGDGTHPIIMLCDGSPTQPAGCPVAGQRG